MSFIRSGLLFFLFLLAANSSAKAQPVTMEIGMPGGDSVNSYPPDVTLTLLLAGEHKIYYYDGLQLIGKLNLTGYDSLHAVVARKRAQLEPTVKGRAADKQLLHVVIKCSEACFYSDIVNVLDELVIAKIAFYAIVDMNEEEKSALSNLATK